MKITFVGTSHGVPATDRYCTCTMVEVGSAIYLIDIGAPVTDLLPRMGRKITDIRAVFNTHAHGDHANGLLSLVDLATWYYRDASMDVCVTEQRFADGVCTYVASVLDGGVDTERIRFRVMSPAFVYEDENIRLTVIPTKHMGDAHPSYAFLMEAEGKKVLFSGDLSYMLQRQDVPSIIAEEELDVFICEMAHFGSAELTPYLANCKARAVYFNHTFPEKRFDEVRALNGKYPFPVYLPSDGDEIVL